MRCFVTGGAGFIGSHLVERLLATGHEVISYDNVSTGKKKFLKKVINNPKFKLIEDDVLYLASLINAMKGCDFIFHFAANADVRFGLKQPAKDFDQNTRATFNVLEAMRANNIKKIAFSSTGSIYGEAQTFPTPENAPFPVQTSLYGASKLAGEGMISAYCEGYDLQAWIFRFVSILGERYTHGHIFDFYKKLLNNPKKLLVLGNGRQKKSYLYINDCIDAIMVAIENACDKINILNLGADEYCEVNDSIKCIKEILKIDPEIEYTGGERGWIGDNPFIYLDCSKMHSLGWRAQTSIRQAVEKTILYLQKNQDLLTSKNNRVGQ